MHHKAKISEAEPGIWSCCNIITSTIVFLLGHTNNFKHINLDDDGRCWQAVSLKARTGHLKHSNNLVLVLGEQSFKKGEYPESGNNLRPPTLLWHFQPRGCNIQPALTSWGKNWQQCTSSLHQVVLRHGWQSGNIKISMCLQKSVKIRWEGTYLIFVTDGVRVKQFCHV